VKGYAEPEDIARLDRAILRLRRLLNDPDALRARAAALIAGTAKPIFAFAFVVLTATRITAGPATPGYFSIVWSHRRQPAVVAVVPSAPASAAFEVAL